METADSALARLLDRLVPYYQPEAIYLFGSRAHDDHDEESDYDLVVVVADDTPLERLNLQAAHKEAREARVPADIFPCRRSIFELRKNDVGTLAFTAWHEGRCVYGA